MRQITVGTWNVKRGGWDQARQRHNLGPALSHLADATPHGPDILAWPEATRYLDDGATTLRHTTNLLSELLPRGEHYEAFLTESDGHRNHPVLFVNRALVTPQEWWPPHRPNSRRATWGWIKATVLDIPDVWISAQHWTGSAGSPAFTEHASLVAGFGPQASIMLGDFNQTSSWHGERPIDWETATRHTPHLRRQKGVKVGDRWVLRTADIDFLRLDCGYRDLGEIATNGTPTTNNDPGLRIDRIFLGADLPYNLMPDSYHVHPTPTHHGHPISDHRYITATLTTAD